MNNEKGAMYTNENMVPNEPNAAILIEALQNIGYNNVTAIADIIDNSIDAGATKIQILIEQDKDNFRITIADNGKGMTREILDQALKLGSDTAHEGISGLGKYGMGLSTAGLALANKTTVLTRSAEENIIYKSITDVNVIKKQNAFVKILCEANYAEKLYFENLINNESGTIIILEECIGIKQNEITTFRNKVIKNISRIFRKFMNRTEFWVNGKKIEPDDPLRLNYDEFPGTLITEDDYEVNWKEKDGTLRSGKVHIKIVSLPECQKVVAIKLGIGMKSQGFSILRNNREIVFGYLPEWEGIVRHNSLNRFRGEISFSSDMDFAMGVNFRKNGIDMVDSVDNSLRVHISPTIKSLKRRYISVAQLSDEEKKVHTVAEDIINKMANTLTLPKAKNKEQNRNEDINSVAQIELEHMGETGDIFGISQIGKKIIITWNIDHSFYKRFIADNVANEKVIIFADFFVYTLASAQIQYMADDEERLSIIENIISTMSTNIRNLLKE